MMIINMSTFIPQVNVGRDDHRDHFNLGQDTHTTSEIGYIQPTYCRYIIPGSSIKVSSRNLIRLSPLAVPSMGRISLRNYFYFVDIATLWTPFDAMREYSNFTYGDGSVQTPLCVPTFRLVDFFNDITKLDSGLVRSQYIRQVRESIVFTIYDSTGTRVSNASTAITAILNGSGLPWYPYVIRQSTGLPLIMYSRSSSSIEYRTSSSLPSDLPIVSNGNADFSFYATGNNSTSYLVLGKFTGASKRLRKMFIGCGYSFNPYSESRETLLKLFAVFKAWFDTFAVQRNMNFNNTSCYKAIKFLSETKPLQYHFDSNTGLDYVSIYDQYDYNTSIQEIVSEFICQLSDLCYNLPPDYFSASDITAQRGASDVGNTPGSPSTTIYSTVYSLGTERAIGATSNLTTPAESINNIGANSSTALGNKLSNLVMKYVNKRSVVGRKIVDLLGLDGEKDLHNNEHETVHHLGVDSTQINISDVTSLASTTEASLGDFAGRGLGVGQTDTFMYDNSNYGILICLSCVVPQSGYFQGMLRENSDSTRFEFFSSDYDAAGYQTVRMNELVSDMQFKTSTGANQVGTLLGNFGLAPRYQHIKIGRNICNGDMSIPSLQDVMLPYSFDRHFITRKLVGSTFDFGNVSVPSNTPESFRQVRANDAYGDYNRIFQYMGSDYDHFIIQMVFNVDVMSPMKSIANSYDTFQDDDNKVLSFSHQ